MSPQELPQPRVEVWQEATGSWRWRYVVGTGSEQLELPSNNPDESYDAAVAAAHVAYPGVPVQPLPPERVPVEQQVSRRLLWTALTATVSLALMALALRARRWGMALIAPVIAAGVVSRLRRHLP